MTDKQAEGPTPLELGRPIVDNALLGLGLGLGGTALYRLAHGLTKVDPNKLVPQMGISGAANQRLNLKKKKKQRQRDPDSPLFKYKTASNLYDGISKFVGSIHPKSLIPFDVLRDGSQAPTMNAEQATWHNILRYGSLLGGGALGVKAVNSIANRTRKQNAKDDVEAARKEYFDALAGKTAAELDQAYAHWQEKTSNPNRGWAEYLSNNALGDTVYTPALIAALGTGLLGGTYMYGKTKDYSRAQNLQRASRARARLAELHKVPHVNPRQLAALTSREQPPDDTDE